MCVCVCVCVCVCARARACVCARVHVHNKVMQCLKRIEISGRGLSSNKIDENFKRAVVTQE